MIRVFTQDNFIGQAVDIAIIRDLPGDALNAPRRMILRFEQDETVGPVERWDPVEQPGARIDPTMRIGQDEARALLDALTRHFHGAEDTRALRRDYDHERKRVDQLIGKLGQITSALAGSEA